MKGKGREAVKRLLYVCTHQSPNPCCRARKLKNRRNRLWLNSLILGGIDSYCMYTEHCCRNPCHSRKARGVKIAYRYDWSSWRPTIAWYALLYRYSRLLYFELNYLSHVHKVVKKGRLTLAARKLLPDLAWLPTRNKNDHNSPPAEFGLYVDGWDKTWKWRQPTCSREHVGRRHWPLNQGIRYRSNYRGNTVVHHLRHLLIIEHSPARRSRMNEYWKYGYIPHTSQVSKLFSTTWCLHVCPL
jgi:hypothetical protein